MLIDKRIMVVTVCAVVIGISAVVIARKRESAPADSPVSEIIVSGATPMAEPLESGLGITVTRNGLTVVVPGCDIEKYADNFFVHVFPEPYKASSKYANFDFSLADEKGVKVVVNGKNSCVYSKSFKEVSVAELTVGQFAMPAGLCCKILWSRNYVFDRAAVTVHE